jgi:hypothetical protein
LAAMSSSDARSSTSRAGVGAQTTGGWRECRVASPGCTLVQLQSADALSNAVASRR